MESKTAYNAEKRFKAIVSECFSMAKTFHLSHKDLSSLLRKKVLKDPQWKRVPRYVRSYIEGYKDALWGAYWQNVKWVHPWKGELYDKFQDLPKEGRDYYMNNRNNTGFHVYKDDPLCFFTGDQSYYDIGLED